MQKRLARPHFKESDGAQAFPGSDAYGFDVRLQAIVYDNGQPSHCSDSK